MEESITGYYANDEVFGTSCGGGGREGYFREAVAPARRFSSGLDTCRPKWGTSGRRGELPRDVFRAASTLVGPNGEMSSWADRCRARSKNAMPGVGDADFGSLIS